MTKTTISMPMLNTPLGELPEMAKRAEDAGFDGVWSYEFWRNPYIGLGGPALSTAKITLGTAIGTAFSRTPWDIANQAADVDELSGGRHILGLGTGAPEFLGTFHGIDYPAKPLSQFKEFVEGVRASWRYLSTGDVTAFDGEFYKIRPPPVNPWGRRSLARADIPIYMAGMQPRAIQAAGELADGLIGVLYTPSFITDVALPNLEAGARRAGRDPAGVDLVGYTICSCSTDRAEAKRRARIQVGMYVGGSTLVDRVVAAHGLVDDQLAIRQALMTDGPDALERVTSDRLVETFSISGTPDECRKQIEPYRAALANRTVLLHTPYVPPLSREESADAFWSITEAFGS
ncbi:LLM class flavin-dependent oxidoreductase [Mycobacterium sp.]|uniref:LLM class flavin-dependent oxidoreductase n=1 Tax=Mycobacterium sp. TaxID=1785 RepID=UPI003BB1AD6F